MAVVLFGPFFTGTFYRSATLYHPQRRAILHLKTQQRKLLGFIFNSLINSKDARVDFILD